MFPKQVLVGIIIAKAVPVIKIKRSETNKIGYTILPSIIIRSNIIFLKEIQLSLSQHQIKSKFYNDELIITSSNMRTLVNLIPEHYSTNKEWEEFRIILSMMERKKHLTLSGLETIMKMKGIL
jgi:hypothetical protein